VGRQMLRLPLHPLPAPMQNILRIF
jgi:hypothetical protein